MKIFISYASQDRDQVAELVSDLALLDHDVWFDQELSGGHQWWDRIMQEVQACDLFIFALTAKSLDSHPCKLEYGYANTLHKRILPVLLADVNADLLPAPLAQIQYVDYRAADRKAALLLNRALNALPPAVPLPDPLPEPPRVPLSPLADANARLDQPTLNFDEQAALLMLLKDLLHHPDTASAAQGLLERFKLRPDLLASIAGELSGLPSRADVAHSPSPGLPTVKPPAVVRPINLGFEGPVNLDREPNGWFNSLGYVMGVSAQYRIRVVPRPGGEAGTCVRLRSPDEVPDYEFGSLMQRTEARFLAGHRIRFQGEIRSEDVVQWAGLWLRADGDVIPDLLFDNMAQRPIKDTTDWKTYMIEAQLPDETAWLNYGVVLMGTGTLWADNFRLMVWQDNQWRDI